MFVRVEMEMPFVLSNVFCSSCLDQTDVYVSEYIFIYLKNKKPTRCHLLFYSTSYRLNIFRALLCPSLGTCDYAVELPYLSFRSWFAVCWRLGAVRLE